MLVPKSYELLVNSIETGVAHGVRRVNERFDPEFPEVSKDEEDAICAEVLHYILEAFDIVSPIGSGN